MVSPIMWVPRVEGRYVKVAVSAPVDRENVDWDRTPVPPVFITTTVTTPEIEPSVPTVKLEEGWSMKPDTGPDNVMAVARLDEATQSASVQKYSQRASMLVAYAC